MAFGISFGKKKSSSTTNSTLTKDTSLEGSQVTSGLQSQSSTQQSNTTGTSTTTQGGTATSNQTTSGTESGRQTGTTSTLGADVQASLSDRVQSILAGGVTDANLANLSNMIAGRSGFDPDTAVSGIMGEARNRGEQTLQEQNSAFASRVGGTAQTNSMAALLAQRGRNDLESSLASTAAQARMAAEQTANANLGAAAGAQGQVADIATQLGSVLKGGTTSVDMTNLTSQLQNLIGSQATNQTSTTQTAEQQQTQMNQLLAQLSQVLTSQNESVVGTENSKTKGKSSGGGFSLGF